MAVVSLNLDPNTPKADVLTLDDGRVFIVLRLGNDSVSLPGFGVDAIAYARQLLDVLISARQQAQHKILVPCAAEVTT